MISNTFIQYFLQYLHSMMMAHDTTSSQAGTALTSNIKRFIDTCKLQESKFTCKFTHKGSRIHASSHTKRSPNSQIHEDYRVSLLLLLVFIARLTGSTLLFLVPIAGLSSGSIGMVVFSFFLLLFALTRAALGA